MCKVNEDQFITFQAENHPSTSTSKCEISESSSKISPRPAPTLAGACDLTDIKTLLREWVTTIGGIKTNTSVTLIIVFVVVVIVSVELKEHIQTRCLLHVRTHGRRHPAGGEILH